MKYFKVNQTVYDVRHGKGTIATINTAYIFPIEVVYANGVSNVYKLDGKANPSDLYPSLSHEPWPQAVLNPIIEFEEGELVWVKDSTGQWHVRYYSDVDSNGTHYCYNNQEKCGTVRAKQYYFIDNYTTPTITIEKAEE